MDTDTLKETAPTDIPGLVAQARAAYQQTRVKECLALTKALLLVDPGNAAAIQLQSAIRSDMQRDLSDARALIEESRNKPESQKYRKAAEIILLKALYLDPDNEGAKTLLSSMRSMIEAPSAPLPSSAPVAAAKPIDSPASPVPVQHVAPAKSSWSEVFAPVVPTKPATPAAEPASWTEPVSQPIFIEPAAAEPAAWVEPAAPSVPVETVTPARSEWTDPVAPQVPVETVKPTPAAWTEPVESQPPSEPVAKASAAWTVAPFQPADTHSAYVSQSEVESPDSIPFTAKATRLEKPGKKKSVFTVPIMVVTIAVLVGGGLLVKQWLGSVRSTDAASTPPDSTNAKSVPALPASFPVSTSPAPAATTTPLAANAAATKPTPVTPDTPPSLPAATPSTPAANPRNGPASTGATGSLAVSCPIAAEIYIGDKYLGSTPTTLQLPAGNQTIEYRHGDLRTVVTHLVKANETATALITFDVLVQVNARPWAQVYIDGPARVPLGQTPLSDVKLPIGSVLVFENPNFPSKSHKIAVNDKTIQVQMAP